MESTSHPTKILVPLKRVPDPDTRVRIGPDGKGIDLQGVKFAINPFDAIALEEAIRLKDKWPGAEIVAASIGKSECAEQLQAGLAMGADRAVLIEAAEPPDSLAVAKILSRLFERERPGLVLMGKQAIDDDSNQAGQMLAGILGLPQATFVSKVEVMAGGAGLRCSRETDAGIEVVEVGLPAVVTADLRLNEPRYISLPAIIKARKKPIERTTPAQLGMDAPSRTSVLALEAPPRRKAGVRVTSVDELLNRLRTEAGVL